MMSLSLQNKKSAVWLHFNLTETNKARCNICSNVLSYKGSAISNLRKHLRVKHPIVCKEALESGSETRRLCDSHYSEGSADEDSQMSSSSSLTSIVASSSTSSTLIGQQENNPSTSSEDGFTSKKRKTPITQTTLNYYAKRKLLPVHQQAFYNSLILNLIIKDLQPFSIVEDEGFKELIAGFDSSYKLPCRTTLSRTLLPEKYNLVSEKIKLKLKDAVDITLTTDTWTSMATENYISLTAHFIDNNWELHSILVHCFKFGERHTSENLKIEIIKILTEWEILDNVHTIVTDNAHNITNAIRLTDWNHLPCLAHTVNLIVQSALKKIENLQIKVKKTVEYFHRSTVAAEKLRLFQAQMNENSNTLKLINDVQTRWNSTYDMFQRISTIQEPVEAPLFYG